MLHRTACHACLLQQPNIEKSESEFHFGTTYAVAVVATWRIGAKLPCVVACVPVECPGHVAESKSFVFQWEQSALFSGVKRPLAFR